MRESEIKERSAISVGSLDGSVCTMHNKKNLGGEGGGLQEWYRFCYDLGHFLRRHFLRILVAFLRILCAFFAHFMHFRSSRPNAVDAQAC